MRNKIKKFIFFFIYHICTKFHNNKCNRSIWIWVQHINFRSIIDFFSKIQNSIIDNFQINISSIYFQRNRSVYRIDNIYDNGRMKKKIHYRLIDNEFIHFWFIFVPLVICRNSTAFEIINIIIVDRFFFSFFFLFCFFCRRRRCL